ncbi:MAG: hypothetical protein JO257_07295, partial [Deltaproteobacteria bacterium]|nr:hypothetical protein [Deltaproteobacteria bacterium]
MMLAIAITVCAPRAIADDPNELDDVVAEVKAMRARGASNADIAAYVTGVVDRRITNFNSFEGDIAKTRSWLSSGEWRYIVNDGISGTGIAASPGTKAQPAIDPDQAPNEFDRWEKFDEEREHVDVTPGRYYEDRARWAWKNGFGQCAENSAVTYYILKSAGIPAQMVEVPGHAFTVMGIAPDAKGEDLDTWGKDAYIVDSWHGISPQAQRSFDWRPGDNLRILLNPFGTRYTTRREFTTEKYDNPKIYAQWEHNGLVLGRVTDGKKPLVGVAVTIAGPQTLTLTSQKG